MDFKDIWNKHEEYFQTYLRPKNREFWYGKEKFNGERIFMILSALIHESVETQRETGWKWFKKPKELDMEKIREEVIDIWHFNVQLAMEAGMSLEDVIQEYNKKLDINIKRQQEGY